MKNSIAIGLVLLANTVIGQTKEETIRKEYVFEKPASTNVFQLANITGSIEVVTNKDGLLSVEEVVVTNERKWRKMFPDPFPKWRIGALGF